MLRANVGGWEIVKDIFTPPSAASILAAGGSLLLGGLLGYFNPLLGAAFAAGLYMIVITLLRQDELAVTSVIAVHIYVDGYLGLHIVAPLMSLLLLCYYYLARSKQRPWIAPGALLLWVLFLIITIPPAFAGALTAFDAASYYPSDILGALLMFWLGSLIARDSASVRRCFKFLSALGALLALHTLIQTATNVVVFGTTHYDSVLLLTSNYQITDTAAHRAGSFFVDPNWNGTFLATIFFLPLGLLVESKTPLGKAIYFLEMALILVALLFTYSIGAWLALCVGLLAFLVFVGRAHYRLLMPIFILLGVGLILWLFPDQIASQLVHAQASDEVPLRVGAWLTALRVISAYPWTGIGLGYQSYLERSEIFRVAQEYIPLAHPHNSYLEWGAMAGLPVLGLFLALLAFGLWQALRNWGAGNRALRPLLGGGIAAIVALSVNSWTINGWTLPALAMLGWLILGVIASPFLFSRKSHRNAAMQEGLNERE